MPKKEKIIQKLSDHGSSADQYFASKAGGYIIDFYSVATGRNVDFKGFVTQFNDSYEASYNSETVYGRMDPIMTFQGTQRKIDFAFDVIAVNIKEAVSNLARIEKLVTLLYPKYNSGEVATIQAAPLIKVKFANMILDAGATPPIGQPIFDRRGNTLKPGGSVSAKDQGLLAAIESFRYEPNLEPGMFMTSNGRTYPKHVSIDFSMTVLHTHKLGWDENNKWRGDRAGSADGDGMAYPYGVHSLSERSGRSRRSIGNLTNAGDSRFDAQKNDALDRILGEI